MKKILISGGGMSEPIDSVRSITNTSTGATAAKIVEELAEDYSITYLKSKTAIVPKANCRILEFESFTDLSGLIDTELSKNNFDVAIQCAAVSDYSVEGILVDGVLISPEVKISSSADVQIKLKKNPKLLSKYSKIPLVFGFKLTVNSTLDESKLAIEKVLSSGAHFVIHNDLGDIKNEQHKFSIYSQTKKRGDGNTKLEMVSIIKEIIKEQI